jgi:hypothetical protein
MTRWHAHRLMALAAMCLCAVVLGGCAAATSDSTQMTTSGYLGFSKAGDDTWTLYSSKVDAAAAEPSIAALLKPGQKGRDDIRALEGNRVQVRGRVETEAGPDTRPVVLVDVITWQPQ